MSKEVKSMEEVLSEKLDPLFNEVEENSENEVEEKVVEESQEPSEETEIEEKEEEEEPDLEASEGEEKEIPDEEDQELERKLSGHPREFKDLVKSVKDPELKKKLLEAGKVVRAREDKVRLELGNTKKELQTFENLMKFLDKDPAGAIKHIAKVAKVDINKLAEPVVDDSEDYRTPEEKARDKKLNDIEQRQLNEENRRLQEEDRIINQEVEDFAFSKDDKGKLKYPHFEELEKSMFDILGLENQKNGAPKTATERRQRLEAAYNKAVRLDDKLYSQKEAEILRQASEKRKLEIEKARKLKKFSNRSSGVDVKPANARAGLEKIVDAFLSGD